MELGRNLIENFYILSLVQFLFLLFKQSGPGRDGQEPSKFLCPSAKRFLMPEITFSLGSHPTVPLISFAFSSKSTLITRDA